MTLRSVKGLVVLMLVAGLEACATTAPSEPTLYKRLGGREGIALVVDDFVANVADDRINARFKNLPPPAVFRLKSNLADQICEATGGPCSYVGRDMQTAHRGDERHRDRVERDRGGAGKGARQAPGGREGQAAAAGLARGHEAGDRRPVGLIGGASRPPPRFIVRGGLTAPSEPPQWRLRRRGRGP